MSNLLGSLRSAADTLDVLQQGVAVSQNNVMNATTAGYVRQSLSLRAREFSPTGGLLGGVEAGTFGSARDEYMEQTVRSQVNDSGKSAQDVRSLTALESVFPLNSASGIPASLNKLMQSFSAWSVTPNSPAAQQNVLSAAQALGSSFQSSATELSRLTTDANDQIEGAVDNLNVLVGRVKSYNERRQNGVGDDAGLDAQVHDTLEQLSEIASVRAVHLNDGTYTLLLDGQQTLLVGARQNTLSLRLATPTVSGTPNPGAAPQAYVLDSNTGADISSHLRTGKLGSLLSFRNTTLSEFQGDAQNPGLLNRVAKQFADRVNTILSPGTPLFIYDNTSPVASALSIRVNPNAALGTVPADSNGVINGRQLQLAGLASSVDPADQIGGSSYSAFLGQITTSAGQKLSTAKAQDDSQKQLTAQARSLRSQLSGVSLDEEAVRLVEFQRAYQATSRMVSVLTEMTDIIMNLAK